MRQKQFNKSKYFFLSVLGIVAFILCIPNLIEAINQNNLPRILIQISMLGLWVFWTISYAKIYKQKVD
jgi:hypothetical protein